MADKEDYHLQKVGFTSPRGERVQVTRQQNTGHFLYERLTVAAWDMCSVSAAERETAQGPLFPQRLLLTACKYGPCVCLNVHVCVDMCKHVHIHQGYVYPHTHQSVIFCLYTYNKNTNSIRV